METYPSFVRSYGTVHLHTEATVNLNLSPVVHPGNPENDDTFRLYHTLHDLLLLELGIIHDVGSDALKHLSDSLCEFLLARVGSSETRHEGLDVLFAEIVHNIKVLHYCFSSFDSFLGIWTLR